MSKELFKNSDNPLNQFNV